MRLLERLKQAFAPNHHSTTLSHYIPAPNFANEPVENSIWRSDLEKRVTDWRGDCGRIYNAQVLTMQGPLLFPLKAVTTASIGGTGVAFGQGVTLPVAGFAGRPAALDSTSLSAEFVQVNG
jgi:hypothetical protein